MEKKFFIGTLVAFVSGLIIWIVITIYFDPLQQFKISDYPYGDARILNVGLVKNGNYNTIIFGSSTSQNILKKDVDKFYQSNSVNISLPGTTNYEQRKLLEIALKKAPKRVIYGLDYFVYNRGYESSRVPLEKFAYEDKYSELYRYFFNYSTFKGVVKGAITAVLGKENRNWVYDYGYWGNDFKYSRENTLSFDKETQWGAQNITVLSIFKEGYSLELMKKNFDTFYEILKNNENIEFLIYYPPYANLWWNYAKKYECEEVILEFKKYASDKMLKLKNVKLYDFQKEEVIIDNLDNYKDMVHFSPNISKIIIGDIIEGRNEVEKMLPTNYR